MSVKINRRSLILGACTSGVVFSPVAQAMLRIEITGVGANQIPIALPKFYGQAPEDLSSIIAANLERTGSFRAVGQDQSVLKQALENPDREIWRQMGANLFVHGRLNQISSDYYEVEFALFDDVSGLRLDHFSQRVHEKQLRLAAHKIADRIFERLTGMGPMFAARLAYVAQLSKNHYELIVSDSDGMNGQTALRSKSSIISPAWSPNGREIAYVSFEQEKAIVYLHDLPKGKRRILAKFKGNNSAPAFSPDGKRLAIALSLNGLTQLYLINHNGSGLTRFTHSYGIDTEPVWSKDGRYIYFTSDRGGSPQIYRQGVGAGHAERITFNTSYAISPDISADGERLAYIARDNGEFKLKIMRLSDGHEWFATGTDRDESPCFAPNGRFLVYATEVNGRGILGTCSADARMTGNLKGNGDIREPVWSPIIK